MTRLRFIFWDQLSHSISSLKNIHPTDIVLMCELRDEITNITHHPKKLPYGLHPCVIFLKN